MIPDVIPLLFFSPFKWRLGALNLRSSIANVILKLFCYCLPSRRKNEPHTNTHTQTYVFIYTVWGISTTCNIQFLIVKALVDSKKKKKSLLEKSLITSKYNSWRCNVCSNREKWSKPFRALICLKMCFLPSWSWWDQIVMMHKDPKSHFLCQIINFDTISKCIVRVKIIELSKIPSKRNPDST